MFPEETWKVGTLRSPFLWEVAAGSSRGSCWRGSVEPTWEGGTLRSASLWEVAAGSSRGSFWRGSLEPTWKAGTLHRSFVEIASLVLPRDLLPRSCAEVLPGHLSWRSYTKDTAQFFLQRSYQEVSYVNLAKRTLLWSLRRGFRKKSYIEILHRDPLRSCQEDRYRDLVQRPFIEISYRDLVGTPRMETVYRKIALVSVTEILSRSLLHTSCQERF